MLQMSLIQRLFHKFVFVLELYLLYICLYVLIIYYVTRFLQSFIILLFIFDWCFCVLIEKFQNIK